MTDPRTPEEIEDEGALAPHEPIEDADLPSDVRDGDVSEGREEQPDIEDAPIGAPVGPHREAAKSEED